jgi:putative peptide zinc metalloprotease protein
MRPWLSIQRHGPAGAAAPTIFEGDAMDEMQTLQQQRPKRIEACTVERQQVATGVPVYILKDAAGRRYMKLSDEGLFLWQLIDGKHTIRDLCTAYVARFQRLAPGEVLRALARLLEAGFITVDNAHRSADALPARASRQGRVRSLCTWYFCLSGMDGRVTALYRCLRLLYTPSAQLALLIVASAGAIAFGWHCATNPFSPASSLPCSFVVWIASIALHAVIHELAHAATCKHYGRAVHRVGFGWYYFAPVAFVDTSDIWPAGRLPRVLVSAAGPYSNLVLAGIAALAALLPAPDSLKDVLWSFSSMGYVLVLVNINPLLELDGYYILIDLLEIPNLRSRALAYLGEVLRGSAGPEPRLHGMFMLFASATLAYGIAVGLGVLFAYHALMGHVATVWLPQPYAQAIGWALAGIMSLLIFHRLLDGLRPGRQQQ